MPIISTFPNGNGGGGSGGLALAAVTGIETLTAAGKVSLQLDQGGGGILLFHVGVKIGGHLDGGVSHKVLCSLLANAHPVEI